MGLAAARRAVEEHGGRLSPNGRRWEVFESGSSCRRPADIIFPQCPLQTSSRVASPSAFFCFGASSARAPARRASRRRSRLFRAAASRRRAVPAEAPAVVPEDLASEFDAMGVRRLYVAAASLSAGGQVRPPASAERDRRPVVLVLMGEPGAKGSLRSGQPAAVGEAWANGAVKLVAEAKGWAKVAGVHFHVLPAPGDALALAKALPVVKSRLKGLTVSVTLLPGAPEGTWEPLDGAADEALVFSFGRRPETADTFVREMSQDEAKAFPIPFRLLLVPGGYGVAGSARGLVVSPTARSTSSRRTGTSISTSRPSSPAIPAASITSSRGPV